MEEFGKLPSEMFKEFDEEAIASASIAQVHRATLFDGTKVAVKVQKPSIRAQLKWDLACYKLIVRLFEWNFDLPIYWTVPTTVDAVTSESDFRCEAEYTRRSGELLEDDTGYVPEIYNDLTTSRVMVMEWIDGVKITDSKALQKLGFSTKQAMENVVKIFSHQLFVTGLVHADPHPGNMFIRAHPANPRRMQVVLLDHGLCIDQREEFRMQYCDLWKSMILMDNAGVRRVCEQWGIGDADLFATMQLMKPFNSTAQAQAPQQNVIDRQVNKKDINNFRQSTTKDRIRALLKMTQHIPTELVLVGRHINIIRGVNKMLGIPVNRINVMARYAVRGEQVTRSANVTPEGQLRIPLSMRFSQNWAEFKFNMHLFWIDVLYYTVRAWNTMKSVMISDHPFKAKDIEDIVQAGMGVMLPNVEVDVDFG
jgi:aarF domain-containing kinase